MAMLWPLVALAALVLTVVGLALLMFSRTQVAELQRGNEQLETRLATTQEQYRLELLAMGQRIIEADKQLRRLNDRVESLEALSSPTERYGQLDPSLVARPADWGQPAESTGEARLRSLLHNPGQAPKPA